MLLGLVSQWQVTAPEESRAGLAETRIEWTSESMKAPGPFAKHASVPARKSIVKLRLEVQVVFPAKVYFSAILERDTLHTEHPAMYRVHVPETCVRSHLAFPRDHDNMCDCWHSRTTLRVLESSRIPAMPGATRHIGRGKQRVTFTASISIPSGPGLRLILIHTLPSMAWLTAPYESKLCVTPGPAGPNFNIEVLVTELRGR